jgi:prolyl-tRNA editing enzyme YbaK/EbsC (Cys-tRNA(Pro) deacylase)
MEYHPTVQKILDLLKQNGFWFETFEHGEVKTSQQAALTRPDYTLRQGTKAMIVRAYNTKSEYKFIMLVFPADQKFDSKKIKTALGFKDIRFAAEEEVEKITGGVKIGGVPPFGNLFNLPVYADPSLFENEKIVFNAGDRKFSLAMKSADYKTIVKPQIINII